MWTLREGSLVPGGIMQCSVTLTNPRLFQPGLASSCGLRFSVPIGLLEAVGVLFPWEGGELGP